GGRKLFEGRRHPLACLSRAREAETLVPQDRDIDRNCAFLGNLRRGLSAPLEAVALQDGSVGSGQHAEIYRRVVGSGFPLEYTSTLRSAVKRSLACSARSEGSKSTQGIMIAAGGHPAGWMAPRSAFRPSGDRDVLSGGGELQVVHPGGPAADKESTESDLPGLLGYVQHDLIALPDGGPFDTPIAHIVEPEGTARGGGRVDAQPQPGEAGVDALGAKPAGETDPLPAPDIGGDGLGERSERVGLVGEANALAGLAPVGRFTVGHDLVAFAAGGWGGPALVPAPGQAGSGRDLEIEVDGGGRHARRLRRPLFGRLDAADAEGVEHRLEGGFGGDEVAGRRVQQEDDNVLLARNRDPMLRGADASLASFAGECGAGPIPFRHQPHRLHAGDRSQLLLFDDGPDPPEGRGAAVEDLPRMHRRAGFLDEDADRRCPVRRPGTADLSGYREARR